MAKNKPRDVVEVRITKKGVLVRTHTPPRESFLMVDNEIVVITGGNIDISRSGKLEEER